MATEGTGNEHSAAVGGGGGGGSGTAEPSVGELRREPIRSLHPRSFKLRFAGQREMGRSYVSLVKPLGLPATVTDKFYGGKRAGTADDEATRRALLHIEDMFGRGPRDKYNEPLTTSQEYGWYAGDGAATAAVRRDRRLHHHIRDSAWLKARLCVLAADDKLKQQ